MITISNKNHRFNSIIPSESTAAFIENPQTIFIKELNVQVALSFEERIKRKDIFLQILKYTRISSARKLRIDPESLISIGIIHEIIHYKIINQDRFMAIHGTSIQMWNNIANEIILLFTRISDYNLVQLQEFFLRTCANNEEPQNIHDNADENDDIDENLFCNTKFQFSHFNPTYR
jgi:hypothetical protein